MCCDLVEEPTAAAREGKSDVNAQLQLDLLGIIPDTVARKAVRGVGMETRIDNVMQASQRAASHIKLDSHARAKSRFSTGRILTRLV